MAGGQSGKPEKTEHAGATPRPDAAKLNHELRSSLSAILLWTKMLQAEPKIDPALLSEGLQAIEQSAKSMQEVLDIAMKKSS